MARRDDAQRSGALRQHASKLVGQTGIAPRCLVESLPVAETERRVVAVNVSTIPGMRTPSGGAQPGGLGRGQPQGTDIQTD